MIREFCDRCMTPVGEMHDGGRDQPKFALHELKDLFGPELRIVVCKDCFYLLGNLIDFWRKGRIKSIKDLNV